MLGSQERQALVELAVLVVGDQVDRTDGDEALLDRCDPLPHRAEVARRIVTGEERRGVHPVHPPRLLPELLTPHATLGRTDVDLVGGCDHLRELAIGAARFVLHGAQLAGEPIVVLARASRLGVAAIALGRNLLRADVGTSPLIGEPRRPLRELGLTPFGLGEARNQIALDLIQPRELPAERLHTLGRRREIHTARGELCDARGLTDLRGIDRLPHARHGGLEHALRVARNREALREPHERRAGLGILARPRTRTGRRPARRTTQAEREAEGLVNRVPRGVGSIA